MARFCNKCGSPVNETARFCNSCGNCLPKRNTNQVKEEIPRWNGWEPSANATNTAGSAFSVNQQAGKEPMEFAAPLSAPAPAPAPVQSSAPQYWESYEYKPQSEQTARPETSYDIPGANYASDMAKPRDASRILPPLSDFFTDADDDLEDMRERAMETVMNFSLWSAGIVLCPVPFTDLVLLLPIQSAMVVAIGKIYGVKDTPEKILAILAGACGASVFGQITTLFIANLIPFFGAFLSAPLVFGWTYGLGEVAMRYFESQGAVESDELKQIFKKASKEASSGYDPNKASATPKEALDNIRDYVSEEEYQKIKDRFVPGKNY